MSQMQKFVTSKKVLAAASKLARRKAERKLNNRQRTQVKRLIANTQELKWYDNGQGATGVLAAGAVTVGLSTVSLGTGDGQRIGDRIECKKFRFRYTVIGADATNSIRVMLFRWYGDDLIDAPTVAKILQQPAGFAYNSDVNADEQFQQKYHVMYDATHVTTLTGPNIVHKSVEIFGRNLGRKYIEFNQALTSGVGNIYLLSISDSIGAPNPSLEWYGRLLYTDS